MLIEDKDANLEELLALIEEPQPSMRPKKKFNHIGKILKNGRELWMNAQIGNYDMDLSYLNWGQMLIF